MWLTKTDRRHPAGIAVSPASNRRSLRGVFLSLTVLLFAALVASAADLTFTASVDNTRVAQGEYFEVTFTLNGASGGKNFRAPSFKDFQVLSGPSQSTSVQFINGAMNASLSYTYVLQAIVEGKFTIGPASLEAGGQNLQTQPITIEVVKGSAAPKKATPGAQDVDIARQIGDNLILKASVDKSSAYQGEQITVRYKLYTRVSIDSYNVTKNPSLTGFWSEDLQQPGQIPLTNEVLNGKQYRVGTLKQTALFAQRSGTLQIDPMELECAVPVQRRSTDPFDQFFNPTTRMNYKVASSPIEIRIEPLPPNPPAGFSGAVGKFAMEATLDKQEVQTNDPVTLKVKISGRGNLKLLDAPAVEIPPDLERFDPKTTNKIATDGGAISGTRTFEYLLIPRHAGEQKIPSIPFAYFDLARKAYVPLNSPEFVIRVRRGPEGASVPSAGGRGQEDVRILGEDIRFIKSGHTTFARKGDSFVASPLFFALYLGSPLAFAVLAAALRRRAGARNGDSLRNRKARKMAKKRLSKAKGFLQAKKKEEFYAEVSRALWGYLADKLLLPQSELAIDGIRTALQSRGVSENTAAAMVAAIEECEFARFAPGSDSMQMDRVWENAVKLVSSTEEEMR